MKPIHVLLLTVIICGLLQACTKKDSTPPKAASTFPLSLISSRKTFPDTVTYVGLFSDSTKVNGGGQIYSSTNQEYLFYLIYLNDSTALIRSKWGLSGPDGFGDTCIVQYDRTDTFTSQNKYIRTVTFTKDSLYCTWVDYSDSPCPDGSITRGGFTGGKQ